MLNTTNSNSEYLHNYIRRVAKQEQESVDTSNVYTGTIEATQSGIYTVTLNQSDNSSSVLAIPIVTGDIYDKKDYVYLLKANTTAIVNYFIVGKVDAVQETFFNLTDLERFNPDSAKTEDYVFGTESSVFIEDENNIFNNISNLGYFQFEVKFNSKIDNDTDGFEIYFNYDVSDNEYDALFTFKAYEFIGQPNEEKYSLVQKKIFHLPTDITITNIKIKKIGNFTVLGVNLVAGSLLEVSAAYQNNIIVQNDRNYFEKEMSDTSNPLNTITLTSKVYYNNKPLVGDALQYYWFLKDDEATDDESSDYLDIEGAGNGWRCLNAFTSATTADGQEIRLWDNKNNFIVLNKTNEFVNFSNFVNKVKCIVKYFDNFISSDEIEIFNYDKEEFTAVLSTNVSPALIINREDSITLECQVDNGNNRIDLKDYFIIYDWYLGEAPESLKALSKMRPIPNLNSNIITVVDKKQEQKEEDNVRDMVLDIENFFCVATIYHKDDVKNDKVIDGAEPVSVEISNSVQIESVATATDIQEEVQYKYYIADNHSVTFEENIQVSEDTELSKWSGDWDIYDSNVTQPTWTDGSFEVVFNDLNLFSNKDTAKEYFVYYTKRAIARQGLEVLRKETGSFPQIARSVIYLNSWKNYRVENSINQLNTFNQLSNNGKSNGIYYSDIPELVEDDSTPVWGTTYYKQIVTDSNITYEPITLTETISFKETETYYVLNEDGSYSIVAKPETYNSNTDYYKKINDTEYQKLVVNTQNFDITVAWPDGENGPFYKNIDNKLFINATYIRSGTLEVKDKFYASIDQDDVRIAGFSVNETTLESNNGSVGLNSDNSQKTNIAIWAGDKSGEEHPFQVTHGGKLKATDAEIKGKITATELFIGTETEENNFNTIQQNITETVSNIQQDVTNNKILIENTKKELQQQIDGEITTWFEEGVPIPNDINQGGTTQIAENKNPPSNQWVDDNDKIKHEGDLYYDTNTQYCFRWIRKGEDPNYTWIWAQIADEGITEALAAAAAAEALADKKRQIFYLSEFNIDNLPNDYNVNDMLIVGALAEAPGSTSGVANTQIYICITDKSNNNKDLKHWQKATDMINSSTLDNQVATINQTIVNLDTTLQGKIDEKVDIWYNSDSNDPSSEWSDDDKKNHIGDLWYKTNGTVYYWTESEWKHIEDPAIGEALGVAQDAADAASQAQATADGKITTYYSSTKPENPQVGDLWVPGPTAGGNKENKTKIYIEKTNGSFEWVDLDDSVTKNEVDKAIEEATETITGEYTSAIADIDAKYSGSLYLTAGNIPNGDGTKMPAIVLKAKEETGAGLIYFNTNQLVIDSQNLKLNHNGSGYSENYLEINTTPLQLTPNKLVINIENTTFNGKIIAQEVASDAIRSINYSHVIENKASAPTLDNGGVQVGSYIFAKQGTFLDLNKGNLYTPNLLLLGEEGDLVLRGTLQNWIKSNLGYKPNNLKFYMLLRPTRVQSTDTSYGSSIHTLFFDKVEIIYPAWWVLRKKTEDQYADWTNFKNTEAPTCHFQNSSSFKSEKWIDYSKLEIIQKEQKIIVNGEAILESDYWSDPLTSIQINDFDFGFDFDGLKTGSACINLQDQPSLAVGWYFSIDEDGYMINTRGSLGEAFKHSQGTVDNLYFYPSNSSSYTYDTLYSGSYFSNLDGKCGLLSQNYQSKENVFDLAKDIFLFAGAPIPIWEHKNSYSNKHTWWGDVNHANLKITTNGDLYLTNFPVVRPTGYNPLQSTGTLSIVDWGNLLEERDITYNDSYAKNKIFKFLQMIDVKKVKQKDDPLNKYRFSLTTRELYQAADNPNQSLYPNEYFDPDVYACGLTYNYKYKTNSSSSVDGKSIGIRYDEIIAMLVVAAQEELEKQNDLRIVKSGTTTLTQSSGWKSKSVSFGKSLGSVPTVFCSVEHSGAAETAVYYYRITNVTTNGFTVHWYHNASSGSIDLKWMAII